MSNGRGGRARALDKGLAGTGDSNTSSNRSRNSNGSVASTGHTAEAEKQQLAVDAHAQRQNDGGKLLTALQEASAAASTAQQQVDCSLGVIIGLLNAC
jgi:hypothetical protein